MEGQRVRKTEKNINKADVYHKVTFRDILKFAKGTY